jgi:hypothetical protein
MEDRRDKGPVDGTAVLGTPTLLHDRTYGSGRFSRSAPTYSADNRPVKGFLLGNRALGPEEGTAPTTRANRPRRRRRRRFPRYTISPTTPTRTRHGPSQPKCHPRGTISCHALTPPFRRFLLPRSSCVEEKSKFDSAGSGPVRCGTRTIRSSRCGRSRGAESSARHDLRLVDVPLDRTP